MVVEIRWIVIGRMKIEWGFEFAGAEMRRLAEGRRRRNFDKAARWRDGCDAGSAPSAASARSLPPHQLAPFQVEITAAQLFRDLSFRIHLDGTGSGGGSGGSSGGFRVLLRRLQAAVRR